MTDRPDPRSLVKRAGRSALRPVVDRLDAVGAEVTRLRAEQGDLSAAVEQSRKAVDRTDAYIDQVRSEVHRDLGELRGRVDELATLLVGLRSIVDELAPADGPAGAGVALRDRFDHTLLHAQAVSGELRDDIERRFGEVRSSTRLTQSLVERALAVTSEVSAAPAEGGSPSAPHRPPVEPAAHYDHPVPTFDLLYRAFEDRHRGSFEEITERQQGDYLELLEALPNEQLPIVDLGCGRGELVTLLHGRGHAALGVDANTGQVSSDEGGLLIEDDLFRWLDGQGDQTVRAVVSAHVIEHLAIDEQIRLVFESYRVLPPGGALILETPNALSLSTAATNFWVDPTHERPVHPLYLEFLAHEAGFGSTELRPLHAVALSFRDRDVAPGLVDDLDSLLFGHGDVAFVARR